MKHNIEDEMLDVTTNIILTYMNAFYVFPRISSP